MVVVVLANDLSVNQISTVLTDIVKIATGIPNIPTPVSTADFVTIGQLALKCGYDPMLNAISQVLGKTIFSARPAQAEFNLLQVDRQRFGNHVRKINPVADYFEDNQEWLLTDGQSVDMFAVNKPKVVQTNFYGMETYAKSYTIFMDQLNSALTGADQFGSYLTMITTQTNNMITLAKDSLARMLAVNAIAGVIDGVTGSTKQSPARLVRLIPLYNSETGSSVTKADFLSADTFPAFIRWMTATIGAYARMLKSQTYLYHTNITGKPTLRHSPKPYQRLLLTAKFMEYIRSMVLSNTYHDNYLKIVPNEMVSFWQTPENPYSIDVTPALLSTDGSAITGSQVITDNVLGILYDFEAMGVTWINEWSAMTPLNTKGGYWNWDFHFTGRYWTDFTENMVVFLLE